MRWHTVDYAKDHEGGPWTLLSRGFRLHDVPRLMLLCRLLGHRPVVDGYGPTGPGLHAARWVVCDRCGVRPDPQGALDPEHWSVGQPYTAPGTTPKTTTSANPIRVRPSFMYRE